MGDVVNVDASRGHVRGNQDIHLALAERAQRLLARALPQVSVQRAHREAAGRQILAQAGSRALSAAEDHGAATPLGLQDAGHDLHLVHGVNPVDDLLDRVHGLVLIVRVLRANVRGVNHEAARQGDHRSGHRRGEEHGVAVLGHPAEQRLHVGQETQVQHLVGLVEDDRLDAGQVQVPLAQQVDEAPGGPHDDVGPARESLDLGFEGDAAVDLHDAGGQVLRGVAQVLSDLLGELAGRQDDEGLGLVRVEQVLVALLVGSDDILQDGDAEAESLAGPRLGLADDVVAIQRGPQGQRLNREGVRDSLIVERVNDGVGDAKVGERLLVQVLVATVGDVGGGFLLRGGLGVDVAQAHDPRRVLDGRGVGGHLGAGGLVGCVVAGGGRGGLVARVGHDLPCLPGSSGVGVGADRALPGAGMHVRASV